MMNLKLANLQINLVKKIYQEAYSTKRNSSSNIYGINNQCLKIFGTLIRNKRIENIKNLLPYTIIFLKKHHLLKTIIYIFLKDYPQRKLDHFPNAIDFYHCLIKFRFKDINLRSKVLDIATYEVAIARSIYYSDHHAHHTSQSTDVDNGQLTKLDKAAQIISLSYDIRPLIAADADDIVLAESNLRLLICWDYQHNCLRIFELSNFNFHLLSHLKQLSLYAKFIGITQFWQYLIRIKVMEIKL